MGTRRDPLGISAWRSTAHRIKFSSQAPVHSVLVQKSVTTITKLAGRLSSWMLGESRQHWQEGTAKKLALGLPGVLRGPFRRVIGMDCVRSELQSLLLCERPRFPAARAGPQVGIGGPNGGKGRPLSEET